MLAATAPIMIYPSPLQADILPTKSLPAVSTIRYSGRIIPVPSRLQADNLLRATNMTLVFSRVALAITIAIKVHDLLAAEWSNC